MVPVELLLHIQHLFILLLASLLEVLHVPHADEVGRLTDQLIVLVVEFRCRQFRSIQLIVIRSAIAY